MKVIVVAVLVFACLALCQAQDEDLNGFMRGPHGALLHPDCHTELPQNARLIDQDSYVTEDGTIVAIPPCVHSVPGSSSNSNSSSRSAGKRNLVDGWYLWSNYAPSTVTTFTAFTGAITVPNNPAGGYRGQLLYYFTALETSTVILQPVLWYGVSPAGGGQGWYVAVYYVYNNNAAWQSSAVVQVQPGQLIALNMVKFSGNMWFCSMASNGVALTSAGFPDQNLNIASTAIEIYTVTDCNSFPAYTTTTFSSLVLAVGGTNLNMNTVSWVLYNDQYVCRPHISCASSGSACSMSYGAPYTCPTNAGTHLVSSGGTSYIVSNGVQLIVSSDCVYRLFIQGDGNLVMYNSYMEALWSTGTGGKGTGPYSLAMQGDGNLVLYDTTGLATWNTGTGGHTGAPFTVTMQTDGNLVIKNAAGTTIWNIGARASGV